MSKKCLLNFNKFCNEQDTPTSRENKTSTTHGITLSNEEQRDIQSREKISNPGHNSQGENKQVPQSDEEKVISIKGEDFQKFMTSKIDYEREISQARIEEKIIDILDTTSEYPLAHCISADIKMGKGLAEAIEKKFGAKRQLNKLILVKGDIAVTNHNGRTIYHLITKNLFWEKPTLESLWNCLQKLKLHLKSKNTKKLAIPRIGCGLDKLYWNMVKNILLMPGASTKCHDHRLMMATTRGCLA